MPSLMDYILAGDEGISEALFLGSPQDSLPARLARPLLILLELSGHGVVWFGIVMAAAFRAGPDYDFLFGNLFALLLLDLAVVGASKFAVQRPRPSYNRDGMLGTFKIDRIYSFPSGHSTRCAAIAAFAAHHSMHTEGVMGALGLGSAPGADAFIVQGLRAWAVGVALSRVAMGRHYLLDVTVGLMLGSMQTLLFLRHLEIPPATISSLMHYIHQ